MPQAGQRVGIGAIVAEGEGSGPTDEALKLIAELGRVEERMAEVRITSVLTLGSFGNMGGSRELEKLKELQKSLSRKLDRINHTQPPPQSVIVAGSGNVTINSGEAVQSTQGPPLAPALAPPDVPPPLPGSSDRRSEFVYGSYEDERKEAKLMFWLSLAVTAMAAIIALSAAGIALFHGGDQSTKWVTSIVSTVVALAGGVWHKHARDAREKVSEHVERVEKQVHEDDLYEKTNARIDRIQDPQMRDRANAATLVAELGFRADPDTLTDRVIGPFATAPVLPPAAESTNERQDPGAEN